MGNKADPTYTVIALSRKTPGVVHATGKTFDARQDANDYIDTRPPAKHRAWNYVRVRCTPGPIRRKKK